MRITDRKLQTDHQAVALSNASREFVLFKNGRQ
jgi:hypothetical protein